MKFIFKILQFTIPIIFFASAFLFALIFFSRREITVDELISVTDLELPNQSKEQAEAMNLAQVSSDSSSEVPIGRFGESSSILFQTEISYDSSLEFSLAFELQEDLTFSKSPDFSDQNIPVLYIDYSLVNKFGGDVDAVILKANIENVISTNNLRSIAFSKEFTKLKQQKQLLESLQSVRDEVVIYQFLYPRWGYEPNYKHFFQIDNFLQSQNKPFEISSLVDYIVLPTFGFTNEFSILPFKITDPELAERMLQFHLSENVPSTKIILYTTSKHYVWPIREIPTRFVENYTWFETQAEIFSSATLEQFQINKILKTLDGNIFQSITNHDSLNFISVSIDPKTQTNFLQLAKNYGIFGVIHD